MCLAVQQNGEGKGIPLSNRNASAPIEEVVRFSKHGEIDIKVRCTKYSKDSEQNHQGYLGSFGIHHFISFGRNEMK
jgi:hypothetical protein